MNNIGFLFLPRDPAQYPCKAALRSKLVLRPTCVKAIFICIFFLLTPDCEPHEGQGCISHVASQESTDLLENPPCGMGPTHK